MDRQRLMNELYRKSMEEIVQLDYSKMEKREVLSMAYGGARTGRFSSSILNKIAAPSWWANAKEVKPPTVEKIQKAARKYHCPTCGAEPGRYCVKVADDGHVASKNPQRAPRRRHRVHDLRMLKYDMYGDPLS